MANVMIEFADDWTQLDLDAETIALAIKYGDIRPSTVLGTPMPQDHYDDRLPSYSATSYAGMQRLVDVVEMGKRALRQVRYCEDCGFIIADNEKHWKNDKTGLVYCDDCGSGKPDTVPVGPANA